MVMGSSLAPDADLPWPLAMAPSMSAFGMLAGNWVREIQGHFF
jgi:hypothetical protein